MSTFAVFERFSYHKLSEGKTEDEAYEKACDTLATTGVNNRVFAYMMQIAPVAGESYEVVLFPQWNGQHITGQT